MSEPKTTAQILERARQTLATAKLGLQAVKFGEPEARMAGLRNVIVFGRAVTNVLQNLRSQEAEFATWYADYQAEMMADPLMKHFYELRSRILKEGDLPVHSSVTLTGNPMEAMRHAGPPPAGAKSFFIGDRIGGTGWEVELPNGATEKFYVALPPKIAGLYMQVRVHFSEAPEPLRDQPVEELAEVYIDYLEAMVSDAAHKFRGSSPPP